MTVVCYDGTTLAADSQLTIDDGIITGFCKLVGDKKWDGTFAITGSIHQGMRMVRMLLKRRQQLELTEDIVSTVENFDVGLVYVDWLTRKCYSIQAGTFVEMPVPFADGSGRQAAMAAISSGLGAEEAVETTCKVSASCSRPIFVTVSGGDIYKHD